MEFEDYIVMYVFLNVSFVYYVYNCCFFLIYFGEEFSLVEDVILGMLKLEKDVLFVCYLLMVVIYILK